MLVYLFILLTRMARLVRFASGHLPISCPQLIMRTEEVPRKVCARSKASWYLPLLGLPAPQDLPSPLRADGERMPGMEGVRAHPELCSDGFPSLKRHSRVPAAVTPPFTPISLTEPDVDSWQIFVIVIFVVAD